VQVQNYSAEINHIKVELATATSGDVGVDDFAASSEADSEFNSLPIEGTSLTKENELELKELIQSSQFAKAVKLVHVFKENIPGKCEDVQELEPFTNLHAI
jgi:hypothetical protein